MANNKSAKKRILINRRNRLQNQFYSSSVKTVTKTFLNELKQNQNSKDPNTKVKLQSSLNLVYSLIDKSCKKNIFHKNKAARKKSKLVALLKAV